MKNFDDFEIDPGLVEDINIELIDNEADNKSQDLLKVHLNIEDVETFLNNNPKFKLQLDTEIESLRVLIKMRKSDEITHDLLVKSIGMNPNNASLYKSLTSLQSSLLSIQKQMDETIKNIKSMLKNYQMELNFDNSDESEESQKSVIGLGSKGFIESMREKMGD